MHSLFSIGFLILVGLFSGSSLAGTLTVNTAVSPGTVNLTSEGSADWVHFGLNGPSTPTRKNNVPALLGNVSPIGGANFQVAGPPLGLRVDFSWNDGTPIQNTTTANRIFTSIVGSGFAMTIPVGTELQTFHVYLGGFASQGLFQASLSDNSAPPFSTTIANLAGPYDQRITLNVQADSPNQTLTLQYLHDGGSNIGFYAVTATGAPPGNLPPTANDDSLNVGFETATNGTLSATDPENDALNYSIVSNGTKGTATITNNLTGAFTYTPNIGATGADSFTFMVNDGGSNSNIATISVTIGNPPGGGNGTLTVNTAVSPGTVNLTSEGSADWVHFGLNGPSTPTRKNNVPALLGNVSPIGGANFQVAGPPLGLRVDFSWNDGTPIQNTTTANRIFTSIVGSGFAMTIPVGTELQTFHVYLGGFASQGLFQASLSDNSAPPFSTTIANLAGPYDQRITLNVQADSPNQTLTLQYLHDGGSNIGFYAVTAESIMLPPTNQPPVATNVCDNTPSDLSYNGNLASSVTDPDSPTLSFSLETDGSKGSATVNPDGTFSYVPFTGERGVDVFSYRVDDLEGGTDTASVTLIIGNTRVMPLGDSITLGTQSTGLPPVGSRIGYRKTLYESLISLGYAVDFIGSRQEGQDTGLADTDHEGHGGIDSTMLVDGPAPNTIYQGIFQALENNPADIILLHIGTNDSPSAGVFGPNPGLTEVEVDRFLDEIDRWETTGINGNPVTVIVARIINQNPINPNVTTVNDSVVQMVQTRINNNNDNIIIVDQESALNYPADLGDTVHPLPIGYDKMANVWMYPLAGTGTQTGTGTSDQTGAHSGPGILPICN